MDDLGQQTPIVRERENGVQLPSRRRFVRNTIFFIIGVNGVAEWLRGCTVEQPPVPTEPTQVPPVAGEGGGATLPVELPPEIEVVGPAEILDLDKVIEWGSSGIGRVAGIETLPGNQIVEISSRAVSAYLQAFKGGVPEDIEFGQVHVVGFSMIGEKGDKAPNIFFIDDKRNLVSQLYIAVMEKNEQMTPPVDGKISTFIQLGRAINASGDVVLGVADAQGGVNRELLAINSEGTITFKSPYKEGGSGVLNKVTPYDRNEGTRKVWTLQTGTSEMNPQVVVAKYKPESLQVTREPSVGWVVWAKSQNKESLKTVAYMTTSDGSRWVEPGMPVEQVVGQDGKQFYVNEGVLVGVRELDGSVTPVDWYYNDQYRGWQMWDKDKGVLRGLEAYEIPETPMVVWEEALLPVGDQTIEFVMGTEEGLDPEIVGGRWGFRSLTLNHKVVNVKEKVGNWLEALLRKTSGNGGSLKTREEFLAHSKEYPFSMVMPNGSNGYVTKTFTLGDIRKIEVRFLPEGDPRLFFDEGKPDSPSYNVGFKFRDGGVLVLYTQVDSDNQIISQALVKDFAKPYIGQFGYLFGISLSERIAQAVVDISLSGQLLLNDNVDYLTNARNAGGKVSAANEESNFPWLNILGTRPSYYMPYLKNNGWFFADFGDLTNNP